MRGHQVLFTVNNANVGAHFGSADGLLTGTGSTFILTTARSPSIAIIHPVLSRLFLHPDKRDQGAPRTPPLAQISAGVSPPAAKDHCRLCFNPAHREESCPLMGNGQEWQRLLAAKEVNFQQSHTETARGRSSVQYGRPGDPKWITVPRSSLQKPMEAPAAPANGGDSHPVVMEVFRLQVLDLVLEPGKEENDA